MISESEVWEGWEITDILEIFYEDEEGNRTYIYREGNNNGDYEVDR